ncbi:cytidyltransferase [Pseudomonas gingeri NCPPB 3146 = LMG 5327]|uniref:nicotinate-nucleotide adenylyltransferase n=2 Tax=Pseudomonas gingeri TaxID=117681 RepID=A0A7Y8CCF7_9PSED|nr:adenylyltransferase/cytidyltransferase family protein [Pseudomonas gingeri]NWC12912.1 adenylyltransferase/cytidyltransferase family protein [Pseudomonas gingeri]PNQ94410.1 cytidyltransferase [Pseudomonas gingeri NCPPB 3146 = LMG 5327]
MYELAIYGGAFNPPHAGHAQVMIEASRHARSVWVVPSFRHPHGKRMADYERRLGWLRGIVDQVRPHCSSAIAVCRIEEQLARHTEAPVYSYELLCALAQMTGLPTRRIVLVVGHDVAAQLPDFHLGAQLLDRFSVLCVEEQAGVRSTLLRERLALGETVPAHWMAPGMDPVDYGLYAAHRT